MRHVFICGAKSMARYGGFETFVDKLTEYMPKDAGLKIHVACKANGDGCMDERLIPGVKRISDTEFEYHNAHCFKIFVPSIGPAAAIWYDLAALRYCLGYCRSQGVFAPVVYVLACRIGPWIGGIKRKILRLDGRLYVNPDGHEWLRKKWPWAVRRYWKLSERLTVKQADLVICDSRNIEAYIRREYGAYRPRTAFIAYGAETGPSALDDRDPRFADWMRTHRLTPGGYYLAVGRYVPENNYETMIREMMRSPTNKDFVLITNAGGGQLKRLEKKLRFAQDGRIKFAGAVYDQELLRKIRENAYASLHGHEVGGTNPSLLEGMAATGLNLLLDVKFNREVGGNAALYWTKEEGSLASLIKKADGMTREKREEYAAAAQRRIRENYSWQSVAQAYRNVFKA